MKKNLFAISMMTLVGLYVLLSVIIVGLFIVLELPVHQGILISIIVIVIQFLISPYLTDLSTKWFYHAKFGAELPDYLNKFIQEEDFKSPLVLLAGNEENGLSNYYNDIADELVKINMRDNIDSLNVANAITTILYEIDRQRNNNKRR